MSKDLNKPDLEDRSILFAVRIIRIAESIPKNNQFDIRSFIRGFPKIKYSSKLGRSDPPTAKRSTS